jgi:cytochrome c oxidase subunit IV
MTDQKEMEESQHHIVSPVVYIIIGGSLLVLTGLTVGASYLELGIFNPIVAIAIACIKAVLVVLFFMHVKYSSKLTKLTVFCGLFTFMALIGMTLSDYFTRAWGRW